MSGRKTDTHGATGRRGVGSAVVSGLLAGSLTILLGACRASPDAEPASGAYPGAEAPRIVEAGDVPFVEYATPQETLYVRPRLPGEGEFALLFYRGQGVSRDSAGQAYLADAAASRVLVVDRRLRVVRTVGGPSPESGGVGLPLSVTPAHGGVFLVDVEHPKGLLYFDGEGRLIGATSPPVQNGYVVADGSGSLWAARSPYLLGFEPTEPGEPLLYRFDPLRGEGVGIAEVEPTEAPAWNRLANAGPVAVARDGTAFFAFLLRNELRAYRPDGSLLWRSRRDVGFPTPPPGIEESENEVRFRLRPVTQALAVGPDGLLYALVASDPPGGATGSASGDPSSSGAGTGDEPAEAEAAAVRRLEVYDPRTGALLRASRVPAGWTSFAADGGGRVYRVDPDRIDATAPEPERPPLPDVRFVSFDGDSTGFADYRGKALLVNLWASWCEPCKKELPELKAYYRTLDHDRVEFLAISEDTNERDARRFAAEMGLDFPHFLGRGKMRDHFRYLGLPYTVIADYRGRIVAEFMGFGSPETWKRLTSTLEAEMQRAEPQTGGDGAAEGPQPHHHGGEGS